MSIRISDVKVHPGSCRDLDDGLLGHVQFTVAGGLVVDGVTLRRTEAGQLTLSFPRKRSKDGWDYYYVRPIDDATRREIERQVLAQLGEVVR